MDGERTTHPGLREFQRREELAVDGVVGSDTWKALGL